MAQAALTPKAIHQQRVEHLRDTFEGVSQEEAEIVECRFNVWELQPTHDESYLRFATYALGISDAVYSYIVDYWAGPDMIDAMKIGWTK